MITMYVISGRAGSYSDREWWVVRVLNDPVVAAAFVQAAQAEAERLEAALSVWNAAQRRDLHTVAEEWTRNSIGFEVYDAALRRWRAAHPRPPRSRYDPEHELSGHESATYEVVAVPFGPLDEEVAG